MARRMELIEMATVHGEKCEEGQGHHGIHQESVARQQNGLGDAGLQMDRGWAWCVAFAGAVFNIFGALLVLGLGHGVSLSRLFANKIYNK